MPTKQEMFEQIQRMQVLVMPERCHITKADWDNEGCEEQEFYYRWICKQVGEHANLI